MNISRRNPYSTYNMYDPAYVRQIYAYANPDGIDLNLGRTNDLTNAAMANEYANAHPMRNAFAKMTGGSNGYRPLGAVENVSDDILEAGISASRAGGLQNTGSLKDFFTKNFAWNKGSGLQAFGKNVGKFGNIASGAIQGIQAGIGAGKLGKTRKGIDNTVDDILTAYARNPLAVTYLTEDQKNTLRSLKNDSYGKGASFGDYMPNSVGDVVRPMIGAGLGFLTGGIPGAIINGVGGHINEGITNANESQQEKLNELSALYEVLQQAELEQQMLQRANAQRAMYNMYM